MVGLFLRYNLLSYVFFDEPVYGAADTWKRKPPLKQGLGQSILTICAFSTQPDLVTRQNTICFPPEERLVGAQLHRYIRHKLYWVLHAPRQTGKTTFLQSWVHAINSGAFNGEDAVACYVNIEACQGMLIEDAMLTLCSRLRTQATRQDMPVPELSTFLPVIC
ncbi:MAG: hypothetical protein LBT14_07970 [Treponema sp.]|nr:hypothetical protein [Treponema sp.]